MENLEMSFWNGKKVFVTGHTGFKGSWLSLWLSELGAEVCGYALAPDTEPALFDDLKLANHVESIIADVRDLNSLEAAIANFKPEIVFHLAAQPLVRRSYNEPVETFETNVMGTVNVLEAMRKTGCVKAGVMITTDKVYENLEQEEGYKEGDRLGGYDPYSNSKACAELVISSYRDSFFRGTETLVASARAGNVIGGGDWSEDRLIPDVFRSLIFGNNLLIRNPNSVRPWQHVLEPLQGYMLLAEKLYAGDEDYARAWNFGPEEKSLKSVANVLETIKALWGEPVHWKISNGEHPHETALLALDSRRAEDCLNWKSRWDFESSLYRTASWYKEYFSKADMRKVTLDQINDFDSQ